MERNRKNMKKTIKLLFFRSLKASFTLEAAVVFPIVLGVIIYIFLLVFSLHDIAVAKAVSYRYLISYSMKTHDIYSYSDKTVHNINSQIQNICIINSTSRFFLKSEKNNLKITSSIYDIPVTFSNYNNTENLWAYKAGKTFFIKPDKNKTALP